MEKLKTPRITENTIIKKCGTDFNVTNEEHNTLTLDSTEVCVSYEDDMAGKVQSRTHKDGWVISGIVSDDYFTWVSNFVAEHPVKGYVWGDFGRYVYTDSEEAYKSFIKKHSPSSWNTEDI